MTRPTPKQDSWRQIIDQFCAPNPPAILHSSARESATVTYCHLTSKSSLWQTIVNWWYGKAIDVNQRSIYLTSFHWHNGLERRTTSRQSIVETLRLLTDRWDDVGLLFNELDDLVEQARFADNIPESVLKHVEDTSSSLFPYSDGWAELGSILSEQVSYLDDYERTGGIPDKWRVHSHPVTCESLVAVEDRDNPPWYDERTWYLLPVYPESLFSEAIGTEVSDWIFRVADLVSHGNWKEWSKEHDSIPSQVIEEAKTVLSRLQYMLPAVSDSDKEEYGRERYLSDQASWQELCRRRGLRRFAVAHAGTAAQAETVTQSSGLEAQATEAV